MLILKRDYVHFSAFFTMFSPAVEGQLLCGIYPSLYDLSCPILQSDDVMAEYDMGVKMYLVIQIHKCLTWKKSQIFKRRPVNDFTRVSAIDY